MLCVRQALCTSSEVTQDAQLQPENTATQHVRRLRACVERRAQLRVHGLYVLGHA
jgi:hypothetical protein